MPVKVRCPQCEKVINAPDAARGKAMKCPGCSGRVKVPGGSSSGGRSSSGSRQRSRPQPQEDEGGGNLFGRMDLRAAEDRETTICPKCSRVLEPGADVCTRCGIEVATGQMTAESRRKKALKGPDPKKFYARIWSNPWEYLWGNVGQPIKTMIAFTLASIISVACLIGYVYTYALPPKVFLVGFAVLVSVLVPGRTWFLTTVVINNTIEKKKDIGRVNSDIFVNMALGLKIVLWLSMFTLGMPIIGGVLIWQEMPVVGAILIGSAFLVVVPLLPVVMTHMSMPISYKGWMLPIVVPQFLKTISPSLTWSLIFLVVAAPVLGGAGAIYGFFWEDVEHELNVMVFNTRIRAAKKAEPWTAPKENPRADQKEDDPHFWFRKAEKQEPDFMVLIVPVIVWLVVGFFYSFGSFYAMRGLGMYAFFFKHHLDLVMREKEAKWTPKDPEAEFGSKADDNDDQEDDEEMDEIERENAERRKKFQ